MSQQTASVVFTVEELWLLQSVIRHELAQEDSWKYPPADARLNDQVAECLLLCHENGVSEAALVLTRGDCLAIDYCVPQSAKSPSGTALGKNILLKSFRARKEIDEGIALTAEEPSRPNAMEVREKLKKLNGE